MRPTGEVLGNSTEVASLLDSSLLAKARGVFDGKDRL